MGGERSSTTRQRIAAKNCALCSRPIDTGTSPGGERRCDRCAGTHRIYLSFHKRGNGRVCSFLEPDATTPVGRVREFASPDKIRDMIARTPTRQDQAAKQSLEYASENGRGGLFLDLTAQQYRRLKS